MIDRLNVRIKTKSQGLNTIIPLRQFLRTLSKFISKDISKKRTKNLGFHKSKLSYCLVYYKYEQKSKNDIESEKSDRYK